MDMRKIVEKGYDEGEYATHYRKQDKLNKLEVKFLSKLFKVLKSGKIIDFGSGTGIPYDSYLVKKGFNVTGIDISQKHIDLAKKNVPKAKFVKGEFSTLKLKNNSVDAIVSFYAIFHIPRSEHKKIMKKMYNLIRPKGYILITLGINEMKMAVGKFIDSKMAWSSYSAEKNKRLVEQTGFKIKLLEEEHHNSEHHLWILAQK